MNNMKKLLLFFIAAFCISSASAQISTKSEMIKRRAAQKVGQMNDYISFMANKKKKRDMRQYYRKCALELFIGEGNSYEENGVNKKGVIMETTSVNRPGKTKQLMRDYFTHIIDINYNDVNITATDIADIKVSNLQKISDNQYVCTCQFDQAFVGYRDGRPVYKDITTKRVKCYITVDHTVDGDEYIIKLGDTEAIATKKA